MGYRGRGAVQKATMVAFVLIALTSTPAGATTTDTFSSPDLSYYVAGGTSGWFVDAGRLAHTYAPNAGFVELVRQADAPRAEADITLSSGRSNVGLTVLWKDHKNHLWTKVEITPGNPNGLISIGRRRGGTVTSLLVSTKGGLVRGATYHVSLGVDAGVATASVTGVSVAFSRTLAYRLTAQDLAAFGAGGYAGARAKYFFDEDDGGSRWDDLTVG